MDDLMDPRQNDQEDEDSDEYPPDGTETKRIEEVSGHLRFLVLSLTHILPSTHTRIFCRLFVDGRWKNENEGD